MLFVKPSTGAPEVTLAETQPQYETLIAAVYSNSDYPGATEFVVRATFTAEERALIAAGEDIFISELCWGHLVRDKEHGFIVGPAPFTPLTVTVGMQHLKVNLCELCGLPIDLKDHDGHGLGECVAVCDTCVGAGTLGAGDEFDKICLACKGTGGVPF